MRPTSPDARMLALPHTRGFPLFHRLTLQHCEKMSADHFQLAFFFLPLAHYSNANGAESRAATEKPTRVETRTEGSGSPVLELRSMSHRFSTEHPGDRDVDLKRPDGSERPGSEFPTGDYFDIQRRRKEEAAAPSCSNLPLGLFLCVSKVE